MSKKHYITPEPNSYKICFSGTLGVSFCRIYNHRRDTLSPPCGLRNTWAHIILYMYEPRRQPFAIIKTYFFDYEE